MNALAQQPQISLAQKARMGRLSALDHVRTATQAPAREADVIDMSGRFTAKDAPKAENIFRCA